MLQDYVLIRRWSAIWLAVVILLQAHSAAADSQQFHFAGQSLSEQPMVFQADASKPTLVLFWASWCAICMSEVPDIKQAFEQRSDQLNFVGVNLDRTVANGLQVQQQRGLPYDSVQDGELTIADAYGVRGTPTLFVVSKTGELLYRTNRLHKALDWLDQQSL
ncbi:TlpA family protein disulfide reductase [Oceanobacter mangrovi]|uniref:TlpA family protein disulfide reductase n=1 Tax=Oceanobacter mangrovi TaxID=2862510 RepID=UPI001C8F0019|nr:TlpA disulfide reductase family protein [Oceanobacter mangrovi]